MDPLVRKALEAATDTKYLVVGRGVLDEVPVLFEAAFPGRSAVVIADTNTFKAAGRQVVDALRRTAIPAGKPFVFDDPDLYAEYRFVERLTAFLKTTDAVPVAVGSGTINDLTKLCAHQTGRRYMAVATAASMDGYTAYGSSITFKGSKQTFDCPAPLAVLADLDVIAGAPPEMNASGYADLMAKVTAGADWILADGLGIEPIDAGIWEMVQGRLRSWLADPDGIRGANPETLARLMEGLVMGGFAMQASRSSRPASGAEHQFSHLWDMQHHTHEGAAPSHGFKVGIGTQASAALYEELFRHPLDELDVEACAAAWPAPEEVEELIAARFAIPELAGKAREEMAAKRIEPAALRRELETLRRVWPELRRRAQAQLFTRQELEDRLRAAGAPSEPEQIGITRERLRESYGQAWMIRRRYTVFDLAARTGLFDRALERIFGPEGPWSVAAASGSSGAVGAPNPSLKHEHSASEETVHGAH